MAPRGRPVASEPHLLHRHGRPRQLRAGAMKIATAALAELIVQTRFEDLPSAVVWEAKRRIADVLGAGLAGSKTSVGTRITEFATAMGKSGDCLIWGSAERSSPGYAALANGTMTF